MKRMQKPLNKSIYLNFIRTTAHGDSIMNSFANNTGEKPKSPSVILENVVEEKEKILNTNKEYKPQKLKIQLQIENTSLTVTKEIDYLESMEQQDLIEWKLNFEDIASLAKWDETTKIAVLKNTINQKFYKLLTDTSQSKKILEDILCYRYNQSTAFRYLEKINNLKQEQFYLIDTYADEIKRNCNKLAVCYKWSKEELSKKMEEYFTKGLSDLCLLEIRKLNIYKIEDVWQMIKRVEDFGYNILVKEVTNPKRVIETEYKKTKSSIDQKDRKNHKNQSDKKYCKIHKSCRHTTEECRDYKKSSHMMIREPKVTPNCIKLNINCQGREFKALIDTGAVYSYMSEKIATELKLKRENLTNVKVELADGTTKPIKEVAETRLKIENDTQREYINKFRIMDNTGVDLILGMDFLMANNAKIDLNEGIINLDKKEYEIINSKGNINEYDREIIKKTNAFSVTELEKIKKFVNELKGKNPEKGEILNSEFKIELQKEFNPKPINFSIPISIKTQVRDHIKLLLEKKVIRESNSKKTSPTFVILKKNGQIRMVTDFRILNSCTIKKSYPIPKIQDILIQLKNKKIFTSLDLEAGYYQIKIRDSDKNKTAFNLGGKTYEYNRMAFGLTNAPFYFQQTLNNVLKNLEEVTLVYLDDILIFSENEEDHFKHVNDVITKLYDSNIRINFEKSKFFKIELEYLGVIINIEGIKPDIKKLVKIDKLEPKNRKQLQKVIGFLNYFRAFVPNMATKLHPFYECLKKTSKNKIDTKENYKIIEDILSDIKKELVLTHPDPNKPYRLETDASDIACGAVLKQNGKIIGLYSYTFKAAEKNYTVVEKETLAILKAMTHFKTIVFNCKTQIFTDNKNILNTKDLTNRLNRWRIILEEFDYELKHIKGEDNIIADVLSRLYKINEIGEDQNDYNIIKSEHLRLIHPGVTSMYQTLRGRISKNIKEKIIKVVSNCKDCIRCKNTRHKYGKLIKPFKIENINDCVSLDIKGPIKTLHFKTNIKEKYFYIFTATELLTRFTEIKILHNVQAQTICKALQDIWFAKHKLPKTILTDQGRQFISEKFKILLTNNNIEHKTTSVYNPTGNSITERINKQIGDGLRLLKKSSLPVLEEKILVKLNDNYNRTIQMTPREAWNMKNQDPASESYVKLVENNFKNKIKNYNFTNRKRKVYNYKVGEKVFKRNHSQDKTEDCYLGPYEITAVKNDKIFLKESNKITVNNVKNIKPGERGT